jgi:hypothetical protein
MKLSDLLEQYAALLSQEREAAVRQGHDTPVAMSSGRQLSTSGTLHFYEFEAGDLRMREDLPATVLPDGTAEPTEGFVLGGREHRVLLQTFDGIGQSVPSATLVPDASGFFETAVRRLEDMVTRPDAYTLNAAERLLPWLDPERPRQDRPTAPVEGVLSTIWGADRHERTGRVASAVVDLVRRNKRILIIAPGHHAADELLGTVARALRSAGLQYKSLLSRYESSLMAEAVGMPVHDLGFEAQVYQFYARSRADKATLRRTYERFRELTPLLAYKGEKQRDLDEVKLLEWRLLTQLSDLQGKIKEIDATTAQYESIPVWKRLAMQAVGRNTASLAEYRTIYEGMIQDLLGQLEVAQQRIAELKPEAAIPKDLRPEYTDLKEEIARLGGTKKIREMLAAEEATNRQAFIQNKRVVITTAARTIIDPLFAKVPFDVLIADDAPLIPAPYLLAAAGLVRERIFLSGDLADLPQDQPWRLLQDNLVPTDSSDRPSPH